MGRFLIIDTEKLNLNPEIAEQTINAYLWQHNYLKEDRSFPVMSEEETEQKFKEVWNAADERCCDEWENKEYGAGGESYKLDWEQYKLTL